MRRNIKNIRHRRQIRTFEIPWDGKSTIKILAPSLDEALRIALKLVDQVAAGVIEEVMREEADPGPAGRRERLSGKGVSFS